MLQTQPWRSFYPEGVSPDFTEPALKTIGDLVRDAARRFSTAPALTTVLPTGSEASLSFQDLDRLSNRFAHYLREDLGLPAGARVGVQMPNCLAYPVAAFGIMKAGLVLVNTNPLYTRHEMTAQFKDADISALVISDMFADKIEREAVPGLKHIILASVVDFFPPARRMLLNAALKYIKKQVPTVHYPHTRMLTAVGQGREADTSAYEASLTRETLAALQYTGGTTGVAKGAMLSHGNLVDNTAQAFGFMSNRLSHGHETALTALPVYHIFAFTVNLLGFLYIGAHNVMVPSPRPLTNLQKPFEKYPFTVMTGVNTLFNGLTNEAWFKEKPPTTLKMSVAGGMALQKAVAERWESITGTPIVEGYGLTEASPTTHFNPVGGLVKRESIGVPLPGTDSRVVDDDGNALGIDEPGELIIHGPQVMQGYWNRSEETAKTLKDGWLYTGDIATMDSDGYFHIVDRKKDMIDVSGFNVYPNEVEACVVSMPHVREVAVIGVPDEQTGEAVKAFIVADTPDITGDDVREYCKQYLAPYKVPKRFEFRDELPKTNVGKILRKELRQEGTR